MTTNSQRPTPADAARRLLILKYVVVRALATPPRDQFASWFMSWSNDDQRKFMQDADADRDKFWHAIYNVGLRDSFSPWELQFTQASVLTMTPRQHVDASWRMESAQVLMWALQMIERLPPYDEMADHDLLKSIPHEQIPNFVQNARLRPDNEISKARDLAELWHWRSRTRQLIERGDSFPSKKASDGTPFETFDDVVRRTARFAADSRDIPPPIDSDFPARGKAYRDLSDGEWAEVRSITTERHHAFNWLCGYAPDNAWDETPTNT